MLGIPCQVQQMRRPRMRDNCRRIRVQQINRDEFTRVAGWSGAADGDDLDTSSSQLGEDMASEKTAGTGQKHSHGNQQSALAGRRSAEDLQRGHGDDKAAAPCAYVGILLLRLGGDIPGQDQDVVRLQLAQGGG